MPDTYFEAADLHRIEDAEVREDLRVKVLAWLGTLDVDAPRVIRIRIREAQAGKTWPVDLYLLDLKDGQPYSIWTPYGVQAAMVEENRRVSTLPKWWLTKHVATVLQRHMEVTVEPDKSETELSKGA